MKPQPVTAATFQTEVMDEQLPVIVDLWAPWCGPCRAVAPVLEDLAQSYAGRVKVVKVNTDEEPQLAAMFKVRSIPTLVTVRGGDAVDHQIGFSGRAGLEAMFQRAVEHVAAS